MWPTSFSPRTWLGFVAPRSNAHCAPIWSQRNHRYAYSDLPGARPRALHADQPLALSRLSGDHRPRLAVGPTAAWASGTPAPATSAASSGASSTTCRPGQETVNDLRTSRDGHRSRLAVASPVPARRRTTRRRGRPGVPGPSFASKRMAVGLFDDASVFGSPQTAFPTMKSLNVEVVRIMLTWGGRDGVANKRPAKPTDPADPAYEWGRYDRAIESASRAGIEVLLTIVGTPSWANGGKGTRARADLRDDPARVRLRRGASLQRHVPRREEREDPPAGRDVARLERAEQPGVPPATVRARRRQVADGCAGRLRADLQRGLQRRPRGGRPRARRLRGDGAAWPQRPDELASLDLAPHVPAGGQADGPPRLRRLGAPPVLRRPVGDPGDPQRRPARGRARQHRHARSPR